MYCVCVGGGEGCPFRALRAVNIQGSNPGGGREFPYPSRPALESTQPPKPWVPSLSLGVNRPGRGLVHSPPPSAEDKERVELYIYFPSGPSWSLLRRACALPGLLTY